MSNAWIIVIFIYWLAQLFRIYALFFSGKSDFSNRFINFCVICQMLVDLSPLNLLVKWTITTFEDF